MTPIQPMNHLLASLRPVDYLRLQPFLEGVHLEFGAILCEPNVPLMHVYFPDSALISLLAHVDTHRVLEVGMLGREGVLGCSLALGVRASEMRALVQCGGRATRMRADDFLEFSRLGLPLYQCVNRYIHSLIGQITQISACNRFHTIQARLARWLLMMRDRIGVNHFQLSQDFLSHVLGVRRAGVSMAALALKRQGLINYRRAWVEITNEAGLERMSCECYQRLRDMYSCNYGR